MTDFPNNFDYIIFGTGVTESILSSALSVTGKSVLHIDKNTYYGGYNACLRLSELEQTINKWIENRDYLIENNNDVFINIDSQVSMVEMAWHVKAEDNGQETNGIDSVNCTNCLRTAKDVRVKLRGFEFELIPKLVYCESQTVDALIQSDVTRYLEFKFISKFASISEDKIITIPINRSDIVKTRVFSLRQKRQLTSFLEWCFTVSPDDDLLTKYSNQPLYHLMRSEKNIDLFTENVIIQCLALSSPEVETMQGIAQIQRLLKSFNKFGPYPIMWPNYGSGEIPQAFCRMSAVFGGIYSLSTSIQSCINQNAANGHQAPVIENDTEPVIPTNHRKLKIKLSNDTDAYTDKLICPKSYINPVHFSNVNQGHQTYVCRAILVTDRSLLVAERENSDILILPLRLEGIDRPALLLELPTEKRGDSNIDLYVTHFIGYSDSIVSAKELFSTVIGKFYKINNDNEEETLRANILFECYFTIADLTNISVTPWSADIGGSVVFVNNRLDSLEYDDCVNEARSLFSNLCPGEQFLPRPPNPEDIISLGDDQLSTDGAAQTGGDFPFASSAVVDQSSTEAPLAPGDEQQSVSTLLLAEMDLEDQQQH